MAQDGRPRKRIRIDDIINGDAQVAPFCYSSSNSTQGQPSLSPSIATDITPHIYGNRTYRQSFVEHHVDHSETRFQSRANDVVAPLSITNQTLASFQDQYQTSCHDELSIPNNKNQVCFGMVSRITLLRTLPSLNKAADLGEAGQYPRANVAVQCFE